jgi:hypothetical protein
MACNKDLALDQRDNVVQRSCINTRRRAKIVNHANTAKTSSEKNEYKVDLQRLHEVEEVSNNRTIYTVSRRQRSRYQLNLVLGKLQWHQIADLTWAYYLGQIVRQLSPGPTTEFYLPSHASYPLPC